VWLLDLGNTRLKLARADASGLGPVTALAHGDAGFDAALRDVLGQGAPGEAAWLASVAPEALRVRVEAALEACGQRPQRAVTRAECAGVRIAYADPARLGVDRFLALLAARAGGDQLVVSYGSAITVDLLDARGIHHGGLIGIAPAHSRQALAARFPALDRGEAPTPAAVAFGTDTPEAVAAGARGQALGLVLAAWDDACAVLGRPPSLLVGGGDAAAFADALVRRLSARVVHHEAMVLEGLRVYAAAGCA
jgi:type III pantothenate kinase